jgi:hypothetical protein
MLQGPIESQGMCLKQLNVKEDAVVVVLVPLKEAFANLQWAAGQLVSGPVAVLHSVGPLYPGDTVAPAVLQTSNLQVEWEVLTKLLRPGVSVEVVAMTLTQAAAWGVE